MDLRLISEAIRDHLTTQRAKSSGLGVELTCMYRGVEGRKCAVGILIKDEFYQKTLEGIGVHGLPVIAALESSLGTDLGEKAINLLCVWQGYHDLGDYERWLNDSSQMSPSDFHIILGEEGSL